MQNPTGTDETIKLKRFPVLLIVVGLTIMFGLVLIFGLQWLKSQLGGSSFTADTTVQRYVIGNDLIEVPLNYMRFEEQRMQEAPRQADIVMLWPSGEGYSDAKRSEFEETGDDRKTLFVTLTKRQMPFDMSGRLSPIYSELFEGPPVNGPAGLMLQNLKAGSGYDGEILAISTNGANPWVARCQQYETAEKPTCLRDIFVGQGLSLRYRFPVPLLKHWQEIESLIQSKSVQWLPN